MPDKLSEAAAAAISSADDLGIAAITWWELAWLASNGRIHISIPMRSWLAELDTQLRTFNITPEIAALAVGFSDEFPHDPGDRLIYATALSFGCRLVTKDKRLRSYPNPHPVTLW